jgi:hypothetical protein
MFTNNLVKSDNLDHGGLNIPSKEFVERMWTIHKFVESAMKKIYNTRKIHEDLISFLFLFVLHIWLPVPPFVALVNRKYYTHSK